MGYELFVDTASRETSIALLKDKRLVEYHVEKLDTEHSVGDIYLGRVKKLMPGNNAAFIEVGYEKDAFLHYLDLGPQLRSVIKFTDQAITGAYSDSALDNFKIESLIEKTGKITQVFTKGKQILVQVTKEPISTKGPRLTCDLSLPGTYMVLVPFTNMVSVSKKIKTLDERTRLKKLAESIRPKNFGVIIRTVAEGKTVAELHKDMGELESNWNKLFGSLKGAVAPRKILGEQDRSLTLVRDLLSSDFTQIVVNNNDLGEEIKEYLKRLSPGKEKIVKLHSGKSTIFDHYEIDKKIKNAFGRKVQCEDGGYLVIDHTEALHVIDVNSGSNSDIEINQEANALNVNIISATEIARQLRLRDMGGQIVVDFIDMRNPAFKRKVYDHLKSEMSSDRAKHTILPISRFGLMEITRQRVRPEINISTAEICPMCEGTGEVRPTMLILDQIESNLAHFVNEMNLKSLVLNTHPFLASYLKQGFLKSPRWNWYRKYKVWVGINPDKNLHFGQYNFTNKLGDEIVMS
ncbi:MAG: Rne/Rng family ribonuclease [Bacteroidota bacterium]|nr:Rne/Rng family ribonuclease [Bacteroidota bacterium]